MLFLKKTKKNLMATYLKPLLCSQTEQIEDYAEFLCEVVPIPMLSPDEFERDLNARFPGISLTRQKFLCLGDLQKKIEAIFENLTSPANQSFILTLFDGVKKTFSSDLSLKDCIIRVNTLFQDTLKKRGFSLDIQIRQLEFSFSFEDWVRLGVDPVKYSDELRIEHDCYNYAFWFLKEPRAMESILVACTDDNEDRIPFESMHHTVVVTKLQEWGYDIVSEPAPNDLILYVDKDGLVRHFGIMETSDKVVSKWGRLPVLSHRIEFVVPDYGNWCVFLRKSRGDGLEKTMIAYLEDLEKQLTTFVPLALASPWTLKGSSNVITSELIKLADNKLQTSIQRPPFGKPYFSKVKYALTAFHVGGIDSRADLILRISKLVDHLFKTIDPMVI